MCAQVRGKSALPKGAESRAGGQSHQRRGECFNSVRQNTPYVRALTPSLYFLISVADLVLIYFCFGYSDGENVPESVPVVRPSRRAKTAALEKTKLDLNTLINQEANVFSKTG